ncbi:hypothetical protein RJT34_07862 [Clitoria ternatea]|uniref:CASP-like protein n=1 Tax=Clitoria ternatea TaxID=43366 RepID=A0AAN9PSG0_CLITE
MASNGAILPRCLRSFACVVTLAASTLMLTAHQTTTYMNYSVYVYFGDLTPYWCFVFANFMVGVYSALLICLPAKSQLWRLIVASDAVLVVILSSSCSAAVAIGLMEKNGNAHAGWLPIYHQVPSYCLKVFCAIGCGYVGTLIYMLLQLLSIQAALNSILVE